MADLNVLSLTGRLTADAQSRKMPSGKNLVSFSIANNIGFGDFAKVNFYTVNVWGDRGEKLFLYLKKGTLIALSGEESLNKWTGKDGTVHEERIVTAQSVSFLGGKKSEQDDLPLVKDEDAVF